MRQITFRTLGDVSGGKLVEHKQYIFKYDDDMPDIKNWTGNF